MKIVTTKKFTKQFKKQSLHTRKEFEKRVKIFLIDNNHPLLCVHKLKGIYKDLWSLSITGNIKVIFDKSHKSTIVFITIGSHSELYS